MADAGGGGASHAEAVVNFPKFCSLLQEHKQSSAHGSGRECAMLFGSTGAGKSTLLHLLAGSRFRQEAVQVADNVNGEFGEFGEDVDFQLVPEQPIPGCEIGNAATSTTLLLSSYPDASTGLTYIDTPGFNNIGVDNDDVTVDAANSAGIMHAIRTCSTLRLVFLISVKDELNNTKAGAIRNLFELMGKFIKDAKAHLQSVLMLFTHCDGFASHVQVTNLLNRIGRSKALPEELLPFLRHAIQLLTIHGDDLLVRPAEDDAQTRMGVVRKLLQCSVKPITDTGAALQCPLSEDVRKSLELACERKKAEIMHGLNSNCVLVEARPHLEDLGLLHGALRLPSIEQSFTSALREMAAHAERRTQMAMDALAQKAFVNVRSALSLFRGDVLVLAPFMEWIGSRDMLHTLKRQCVTALNSACDEYVADLDAALSRDDWDAAATLLAQCKEMLLNLEDWCLFAQNKAKVKAGVHRKVRSHTKANAKRAREAICDKRFDSALGALLEAIRRSSEHETLLNLIGETVCQRVGAEDYQEVSEQLDGVLVSLAEGLQAKLTGECVMEVAQRAFVNEVDATGSALQRIDEALAHLLSHLRPSAQQARELARKQFVALKDSVYDRLGQAVQENDWKQAAALFVCLQGAEKLGSPEEQHHVEQRLQDVQTQASTALGNLAERLAGHLARKDYQNFMQEEGLLGRVKLLAPNSVLREASLHRFKGEHDRLLQMMEAKFAQALVQLRSALESHKFADCVKEILHLEVMAKASVGRQSDLGCACPDFNKRLTDALLYMHSFATDQAEECKQGVAHLNMNVHPTEAQVADLRDRVWRLRNHREQVLALEGAVPALCAVVGRIPSPHVREKDAESEGEQGEEGLDADTTDSSMEHEVEGGEAQEDQEKDLEEGGRKRKWVAVKQEEEGGGEGEPAKRRARAAAGMWDHVLVRILSLAEEDLSSSLIHYSAACQQRCHSSLEAMPKPRADDVVAFLATLEKCQQLDSFMCAVAREAGETKTFLQARKGVIDLVKRKFSELRDACGRDVRANRMADAHANLEAAREMLVLRDEFAGDAITLDAAVEEMKGNFDQKAGAFARSVGEALSQERFSELKTLLLGYRDLTGAAEQEEYNTAVLAVKDAGDGKYTLAVQVISSISDDRRIDFPPSVDNMAAALRWIESARCLGEGEAPVLASEVCGKWQSAFDNLKRKLELLRARESKLDEWKFSTVEEMHKRLGQLLMLRFPVEVSDSISAMRTSLGNTLQTKVDGLQNDVERALEEGDYLTIDLIFEEVKNATLADSYYVSNRVYNSLVRVLESFLDRLVQSIKDHYVKFEIKEAHEKQEHLWKLERAAVAGKQVARSGINSLPDQKKKTMISRMWLKAGSIEAAREKVNGFRDVDPVMFSSLVAEFIDSFDNDIKRLRKVDTKNDVHEVEKVMRELPRIAAILEDEQPALKKSWEELWLAFYESINKRIRLAGANACQKDGEQDISDSISVLQAARNLLVSMVLPRRPEAGDGASSEATRDIGVSAEYEGGKAAGKRKKAEDGEESATSSASDAATKRPASQGGSSTRSSATSGTPSGHADGMYSLSECAFRVPMEVAMKELIEKLNDFLGQIMIDTAQIDGDWVRFIESFDCSTEGLTFVDTLHFIRKLKRQQQAIRACGEYGLNKPMPTADRAVSRIHTVIAERTSALDPEKCESGAIIWQNLVILTRECFHVLDDEEALLNALSEKLIQFTKDVQEWVDKLQVELATKSKYYYAEARKQMDPRKRKSVLNEVTTRLDMHQKLLNKLVLLGLRKETHSDTPLVAEIKTQINEMETTTRQSISNKAPISEIADSIHGIYMTAMDLNNPTILTHSETCIGTILNECKKYGVELHEIGVVLDRDFPQGSEILHHIPAFNEFTLLAFQKMTAGKTVEGTVEEAALMNNLSSHRAAALLGIARMVEKKYESIMHSDGRFSVDLEKTVRSIKRNFTSNKNIPELIGGVFAVWSLASMSEQCRTPRRPLPNQIVAIVRLLALDTSPTKSTFKTYLESWFKSPATAIEASHLAQIRTGQGKSVVLGTLATVLCVVGFEVDCVCYSAYLSQRDKNDFEKVFTLFDVSSMVAYGTFQQLSERLINSEGDVRTMTRDMVLDNTKLAARGDPRGGSSRGDAKSKEPRRVLLVDEVDVFFSSSFYGETYDPVERLEVAAVADLQREIWSKRSVDSALIMSALKNSEAYSTIMREYPEITSILAEQIAKMVRDLDTWKKGGTNEPFKAYKIQGDEIAYKSGVNYDSKISFGYVTLWTYFHEVECRRLPEAVLERQLGLLIACGQFSYAEIPKRYHLILGVTGTLVPETKNGPHPLGEFEQEIIRDDYKITGQTEVPSVYGEKNLTFRENEHVSVLKSEEEFNNAIGLEVAKALDGRPVLVFFESESKLDAWQQSTYGSRVPSGTMQCIKSDSLINMDVNIRKATHAGQVTLLAREHGRGLDFNCLDKKVDDLGGLHVVQTFLSEELSEEIQIRGRTARQKNKGSFQMILLAKDLEKFDIRPSELEMKERGLYVPVVRVDPDCTVCLSKLSDPEALTCGHTFCKRCVKDLRDSGGTANVTCPLCRRVSGSNPGAGASSTQTMYQFLHAKRAIFLDMSSVTRREAVTCANAMHSQSIAFQRNLLALSSARSRSPALVEKCLKFLRHSNIKRAKCRLLCLSDATGSMAGTWRRTQDGIKIMLERIADLSGGQGNISVKWVAYRDYELEASQVLEASPWTDDPASLVKFVGRIQCISDHGCDWAEAVEAALQYANNEAEMPTRVVLIGDAPPHAERKGQKIGDVYRQKQKTHASNMVRGGFVEGGVLSTDYREECARLADKGIKVYSFYLGSSPPKEEFDEISRITGGESQKLDLNDPEGLIHAICENALEDIGGTALRDTYRAQYRT